MTNYKRVGRVARSTGPLYTPAMTNQRYDVTICTDERGERHDDVSWRERNRLVDFAFRHGLRFTVTDHRERVRGEGSYR